MSEPVAPKTTRSLRAAALGPLAARGISLVVSAIGSVLLTKMLVSYIGPRAFGFASLVIGVAWLLPVLVAGSGNIIVNSVASIYTRSESEFDAQQRPHLRQASRLQLKIGACVAVVGLLAGAILAGVTANLYWGLLAGFMGLTIAVQACTAPAASVMQGLGHQRILSLLPALTTALAIPMLLLFIALDLNVLAAAAASISGALTNVILYFWVLRRWRLPIASFRELSQKEAVPRNPLVLPATLFTLAGVLFAMSDRYLFSTVGALFLATFAVLQQVSAPLVALTGSVGDGLWAFVETQRSGGRDGLRLRMGVIGLSGLIGLGLGLMVALFGERFANFMLNGEVENAWMISVTLGLVVAASGFSRGAMALLRNERGLKKLSIIWWTALLLKCALIPTAVVFASVDIGLWVGASIFIAAAAITSMVAIRTIHYSEVSRFEEPVPVPE